MLLGFGVCSLGNNEGDDIGMGLENAANALSQYRANQNVGIQHQSLTWHSDSLCDRRDGSLCTSLMSSSSDAPQEAIMKSGSLTAARMASTSALRFFFCAGI